MFSAAGRRVITAVTSSARASSVGAATLCIGVAVRPFVSVARCRRAHILTCAQTTRSTYARRRAMTKAAPVVDGAQLSADGVGSIVRRRCEVIKSPEDSLEYRGLELENGMRVLLVHDPQADKAAAALSVSVGHLSDPRELPGLAHFCEHMLFLGTSKFPDENEYSKYVQAHGGFLNAYTSTDHTNYHFDVAPEHLNGALDRFAQFFLAPLFTESATEREVNAVDSENANNLKSDMWRLLQLERTLSNTEHDYSKFGTGNRQTLWDEPKSKGIETRQALLDFHKRHYSSNIMGLCIVGGDSLDEMEARYVLPYFAGVENKRVSMQQWVEHPYTREQLGWRLHVVPVKDLRTVHISFPLGDERPHYRSQPAHYISHLLGHEGQGSLLSELKRRGWVSQLQAGANKAARGFGFFNVDLDLSEEGLNHVDEIIELVFEYLGLIKAQGVQQWIHDECEQVNKINFRFRDKQRALDKATGLASVLHEHPLEEALVAPYIMDQYKPELVHQLLDAFMPQNMNVCVVSQTFDQEANTEERWYGTKYSRNRIEQKLIDRCTDAHRSWQQRGHFKLPKPNEFIPTDFTRKAREPAYTRESKYNVPQMLVNNEHARLWYVQDDEFDMPKSAVVLMLHTPVAYQSPANYTLAQMLISCFNDSLTEYVYDATLAGLYPSVACTAYGVKVTCDGYNQKLPALIECLLERLRDFRVDEQRFLVLKEAYERTLRNFQKDQPFQRAVFDINVLLCEQLWTHEQLLHALTDVTAESVQQFQSQLMSHLYVEALVHGNETKETAQQLLQHAMHVLKDSRPLFANQLALKREVCLPQSANYVHSRVQSTHANSCVHVLLQIGLQSTADAVRRDLLVQLMQEPAFDSLRTKQQLGYIVHTGARDPAGTLGLRFIVQGGRHPRHVEARVEAFLADMRQQILNMSEEEFAEHREALIVRRQERPKRLNALTSRHWDEIATEAYSFDRDVVEVAALRELSKQDVLNFFDEHVATGSAGRRRLSVRVYSIEHAEDKNADANEERVDDNKVTRIDDLSTFKQQHALYAQPPPHIPVPPKGAPLPTIDGDDDDQYRAKL